MVTLVSARVSLNSKFAMRKYSQLMSVFKHHDHAFDEQKYWHYGCNCQILSEYCMGLLSGVICIILITCEPANCSHKSELHVVEVTKK